METLWLKFTRLKQARKCVNQKRRFLTYFYDYLQEESLNAFVTPDRLEGNNQVRCFIYLFYLFDSIFLVISFYFRLHYYRTSVSVSLDVSRKVINN